MGQAVDVGLARVLAEALQRSESTNSCMSAGERRDWVKLARRIEEVQLERAERQLELAL
jgi:hypothetical protein